MTDYVTSDVARRAEHGKRMSDVKRRVTDDQLLDSLRACAAVLGRTPGSAAYDKWRGVNRSQIILMRFGSWRAACAAAGLVPNGPLRAQMGQRRYSDQDVLAAYVRIRGLIGAAPTVGEWDELATTHEPKVGTIRRRYENKWMVFVVAMEQKLT